MSLGYRVLAATDGQQALSLCEDEIPALAVLDIVMPCLGGPATAAQLFERYPQIPILFTSGYSEKSGALEAQIPRSHYLQKSYSPTALARVTRGILGEAKSSQPV